MIVISEEAREVARKTSNHLADDEDDQLWFLSLIGQTALLYFSDKVLTAGLVAFYSMANAACEIEAEEGCVTEANQDLLENKFKNVLLAVMEETEKEERDCN